MMLSGYGKEDENDFPLVETSNNSIDSLIKPSTSTVSEVLVKAAEVPLKAAEVPLKAAELPLKAAEEKSNTFDPKNPINDIIQALSVFNNSGTNNFTFIHIPK